MRIEKEKLNNFFERFIDRMIVEDIEKLAKNNKYHKSSYPYLALVFSGIDFFGGLVDGFDSPSGKRFKWFINEWMGRVDELYKDKDFASLTYDAARCGIFHNAVLKKAFNVSSHLYLKEEHLHYIKNSGLIFLHSIQFAFDFIEAQKKFRKDLNNSTNQTYVDAVFKNLEKLLDENKQSNEQSFKQFVSVLKREKRIIDKKEIPISTSKATSKRSSINTQTTPPECL